MKNVGEKSKRILTAIVFTDIVGYTQATQKHEAKSYENLLIHKNLARETLQEFNGLEVKAMGDGFIFRFDSSLTAIEFATDLLKKSAERLPELKIKATVHFGEVFRDEDGDIFGNAVNLAARFIPLATAGNILISHPVFQQVSSFITLPHSDLGRFHLKGIDHEVGAHLIHVLDLNNKVIDPVADADFRRVNRRKVWIYGATTLGLVSYVALLVYARESSIRHVSASRGIASIPSGADPVTNVQASRDEAQRALLKGKFFAQNRTKTSLEKALAQFQLALQIYPEYAEAYGEIANLYGLMDYYGYISASESMRLGEAAAMKALSISPSQSAALLFLAEAHVYNKRSWETGDRFYLQALSIDPKNPQAHQWYGNALCSRKEWAAAQMHLTESVKLAPLSAVAHVASAYPDFYQGKFDSALQKIDAALDLDQHSFTALLWSAQVNWHAGKFAEALKQSRSALRENPDSFLAKVFEILSLRELGKNREVLQKQSAFLSEAAQTNKVPHYEIAILHANENAPDSRELALRELRAALEQFESKAIFAEVDPSFKSLHAYPRFRDMLRDFRLTVSK